ncbi:MAG TPA: hypothetical protein VN612_10285, partial [Acidobacteriaceae bacterium]|nr:hypothetical protein [Acidobacteriaceae bacterium]
MSSLASMSADTRNKAIAIAVFVLIAAGVLYWELFSGGTPNPAAVAPANPVASSATGNPENATAVTSAKVAVQPAAGNAARRVGGSSATLDPALRMDAMLAAEQVEYSGIGR